MSVFLCKEMIHDYGIHAAKFSVSNVNVPVSVSSLLTCLGVWGKGEGEYHPDSNLVSHSIFLVWGGGGLATPEGNLSCTLGPA